MLLYCYYLLIVCIYSIHIGIYCSWKSVGPTYTTASNIICSNERSISIGGQVIKFSFGIFVKALWGAPPTNPNLLCCSCWWSPFVIFNRSNLYIIIELEPSNHYGIWSTRWRRSRFNYLHKESKCEEARQPRSWPMPLLLGPSLRSFKTYLVKHTQLHH